MTLRPFNTCHSSPPWSFNLLSWREELLSLLIAGPTPHREVRNFADGPGFAASQWWRLDDLTQMLRATGFRGGSAPCTLPLPRHTEAAICRLIGAYAAGSKAGYWLLVTRRFSDAAILTSLIDSFRCETPRDNGAGLLQAWHVGDPGSGRANSVSFAGTDIPTGEQPLPVNRVSGRRWSGARAGSSPSRDFRHFAMPRAHEEILARGADHLPVIAARIDSDGTIIECKGSGLKTLGLRAAQLAGRNLLSVPGVPAAALRQALRGCSVMFAHSLEWAGKPRVFECHVGFDNSRQQGAIGFAFDVTDRIVPDGAHSNGNDDATTDDLAEPAEAAGEDFTEPSVKSSDESGLADQVLAAIDADRQRIGADLHDDVGQLLTGIACLSSSLADRLRGHDDVSAEDAASIAEFANNALADVRSLVSGLLPTRLADRGLASSLEELGEQVGRTHGVEVRMQLSISVASALDKNSAVHVFRIAQEAIANAVRHGRASVIEVTLSRNDQGCRLAISDNGTGFDPEQVRAKCGSGLAIIRHRADHIAGTLKVSSRADCGTRIEVDFQTPGSLRHKSSQTG